MKKIPAWAWIYALSFPAALFLLYPAAFWGSNGDDGWVIYTNGMKSWSEILGQLFIPKAKRIFLFGTDRPLPFYLYAKIARELGLSPMSHHVLNWVGSWLSTLGFGWGIVALLRLALPLPADAKWLVATLVWWAPSQLLSTATIFPDCWLLHGLLGVFWGLVYSSEKELFPAFRHAGVRYGLALAAAFLACQTQEAAWVILAWTSLWLGVVSMTRRAPRTLTPWLALLPVVFAAAMALLYRSLDPAAANRSEFVISLSPFVLYRVSLSYLLMAFHAVAEPFVSWLPINRPGLALAPAPHAYAFILATAGLIWGLSTQAAVKKDPVARRLSWLVALGGLLCTAPYLVISDRQFIYYGLRLNTFLGVFFAVRMLWSRKPAKSKKALPFGDYAALVYVAGMALATSYVFQNKNWLRDMGDFSKQHYARIMATPGAEYCTSERPCCLEIPYKGWLYNEWIASWMAGAPRNPPFVEPGMPCSQTLVVR